MSSFQERKNDRRDIEEPNETRKRKYEQLNQQYDNLRVEFYNNVDIEYKKSEVYKKIINAMSEPEISEAFNGVREQAGLRAEEVKISHPKIYQFNLPKEYRGTERLEEEILKMQSDEGMYRALADSINFSRGIFSSERRKNKLEARIVRFDFATEGGEVKFGVHEGGGDNSKIKWFSSRDEFLNFIADRLNRKSPPFYSQYEEYYPSM